MSANNWGERMFDPEKQSRMEMETVLRGSPTQKLRDHFDLTEPALKDLTSKHTEAIATTFGSSDVEKVYHVIVAGLTHPKTLEERNAEIARQHNSTVKAVHQEFGWRADAVWAKAKEIVNSKPELKKLLNESGTGNDPTIALALCRQAKQQLDREQDARRRVKS